MILSSSLLFSPVFGVQPSRNRKLSSNTDHIVSDLISQAKNRAGKKQIFHASKKSESGNLAAPALCIRTADKKRRSA
jgi:hypothetical protein